jgi:hypothetical protein
LELSYVLPVAFRFDPIEVFDVVWAATGVKSDFNFCDWRSI